MASTGLNRRSVSWQTGLNAPLEDTTDVPPGAQMTSAALRLSHLLSQVENPGSPTSPVSQSAANLHAPEPSRVQGEIDRMKASYEGKIRLLNAQLVAARQDAERLRRHQDPSVPFLPAYAIDAKPPLSAMQRGQSVPAHMQRVVAAGIEQLESLPESPRSPRRAFAPQSGSLASLLVLPPPPQALRRAVQLEQELEFSQKDREELVAYTNELRRRLERMQQRELELSAKMKENIALVEQTHTELGVARQQKTAVEEKMVLMRAQFEAQLAEVAGRAQLEQQAIAERHARERSELSQTLTESHTQHQEAEARLERAMRENRALVDELDKHKGNVTLYEEKYMRLKDDLMSEVTHARLIRDKALADMNRLRLELEREKLERSDEGERYRLQLNNLQELLRRCEKELADSRQNAVHLTQQLHLTQLQLGTLRNERDAVLRTNDAHEQQVLEAAQQRESELTRQLQDLQSKQEAVLAEADALAARQHEQISRLQAECARLHAAYETLTLTSAERIESLSTQLASAEQRAAHAADQRDALTANLGECTQINEALRVRLRTLDTRVAELSQTQPPFEFEPEAEGGGGFGQRSPIELAAP